MLTRKPSLSPLHSPSRRRFVRRAGLVGLSLPCLRWWGCGHDAPTTEGGAGTSPVVDPNAATASANGSTVVGTIDSSRWQSGGTGAMAASYPNPFDTEAAGGTCAATCAATQGPCLLDHDALPPERVDVSENLPGLPVRLGFRALNTGCRPISGASVEIWHVGTQGLYSGDTPDHSYCSKGDAAAIAAQFGRGVQITDGKGEVFFHTTFPGWYQGRTVHIHVRIRVGSKLSLTTQFFFDDGVVDQIIATQPAYKDRGARTTTNQNDGVVSAAAADAYSFSVRQADDGVMLAWKTVVVDPDSGAPCTIPAGRSGGSPGGGGGSSPPGGEARASGRRRNR